MITLKLLKWCNAFSYGDNNSIDFTKSPLTQLVGKNGHGKSSIALILEEVLFNKNSKGIKKGDILNRHLKEKSYSIELTFSKDADEYRIETKRGSSQTVKLFRNNSDISSHTATATYKQIEEIIGMDHKTFSQIVYQSHAGSLEFLTSPDTARKKFLIELLSLSKYTEAGELFKTVASELSKEVASVQAKVDTIKSWISKYSSTNLVPEVILEVPEQPSTTELDTLISKLSSIEHTNKRINQNNTYIRLLNEAKRNLKQLPDEPEESADTYLKEAAKASVTSSSAASFIKKMSALHGTCPTCLSKIDENKVNELVSENTLILEEAKRIEKAANTKVDLITKQRNEWVAAKKTQEEWEKYHQLVDPSMSTELEDADSISSRIDILRKDIANIKSSITKIETHNKSAVAHNSKIAVIEGQMQDMKSDLSTWSEKLQSVSSKLNIINTLVKTFSTTGLVAYKIENLIKDLEELSNNYLGELSSGRFQISFQISGSDKLNVVIIDNGCDIDIQALSGGERARVNVATLLAIRKLMQSISQSRINLLILDETVEALDVEGKEKLIEVLLGEESLNTILVSHGFSHPLLEKVHVVKHNNISHIEE